MTKDRETAEWDLSSWNTSCELRYTCYSACSSETTLP